MKCPLCDRRLKKPQYTCEFCWVKYQLGWKEEFRDKENSMMFDHDKLTAFITNEVRKKKLASL